MKHYNSCQKILLLINSNSATNKLQQQQQPQQQQQVKTTTCQTNYQPPNINNLILAFLIWQLYITNIGFLRVKGVSHFL